MVRSSLLVTCALACSGRAPEPAQPHRLPPGEARPAAAPAPALSPPIAARRPHEVTSPHGTRIDPYFWLRDDTRRDPAVLGYLEAENAYAAALLAPVRPHEEAITRETRARIDEADIGPAVFDDGYWYYTRYEAGAQHPIYARRKSTLDAAEEIVLDGNVLAAGHAFYAIGSLAVSRDGKLLAWTDDTVGRNQFRLHVKNLATGELSPDTAEDIAPTVVWANDNATLFYVGKDPVTLREDRVMRLRLGGAHELVYHERDASFYVDVAMTKSRRYIVIVLGATTQSEMRLVDANRPASAPRTFIPRRDDIVYELDHVGSRFVMRTNECGANFCIVEVPAARRERRKGWRTLLAHRADTLVESFALYDTVLAVDVRRGGLGRVAVIAGKRAPVYLEGADPTFRASLVDTPDPRSRRVRYTYDSLTTPTSTLEYDVATGARTVVHQEPAPTYDASRYASEYLHATARDGAQVPISLVYREDTPRDGSAPLLVTGYGAYGASLDPYFDRARVSLLDRGWVFAIAHVRGGEELGDAWYEAGRELAKENTFDDFIAVTEHLVARRYAARDRVFAEGASAGGLLIGVIANRRPDLYRGLVAWVPFVDAVTTMLDDTIPLVTNEYEEWGNPRADQAAYDYMLRYSPYDNVRAQAYPAMYVRTGLHDSQVQYYEPAKWVAKLRATKTDRNPLVLETDMTAGHGGKSGRFEAVREQARAYAFVLGVLDGSLAGSLRREAKH